MWVTSLATTSSISFFSKINTPLSFQFCSPKSSSNSFPFLFNSKIKQTDFSLNSRYYTSFSLQASSSSSRFDLNQDENSEDEYEVEEEEEEEEDRIESRSRGDARLYVGNLPYAMTSSQLGNIFGEAGQVVNVQIVYDRVTDRSRGFGFVTMASIEEARKAIKMFDGSLVGGRTVRVNFPEVPKGGELTMKRRGGSFPVGEGSFIDTPHKLYAGNLSWSLTSKTLREAFENQPGFFSAKVIYDLATGTSKGFGFVTFSTAEEAESALENMNGVELEGRPLVLKFAAGRAALSSYQQQ